MQRKLHGSVIFAPTRRFARSFYPLLSLFALGLTSLPVAAVTLVPQETFRPPLPSSSSTSLAARGAVPFPAVPAANEDAKQEPRPSIPAETTKPAAPEALRPATVPEVPKPQAATAPAPAPAAPAAIALPSPPPSAPSPAAPAATSTSDRFEQLRKAADMLIEVNAALGAPRSPYGQIIYDIAVRHSINPQLVAALIHVESAFNPRAVSRKGAYGLMQLLPETGRRFGVRRKRDLLTPVKNLEAGVSYLKWLTERFGGDMQKSLAAYNAGEGAVDRFGGIPPYHETQQYVQRIFGLLGITLPDPPAPEPAAPAAATAAPSDIVPAGR